MDRLLQAVLHVAANVMATGQRGRLVCPGAQANYGRLAQVETTEGIVDFVQKETSRISMTTTRASLVSNISSEQGVVRLVFRVEPTDQPLQSYMLYALEIPSSDQGVASGLEIELLT